MILSVPNYGDDMITLNDIKRYDETFRSEGVDLPSRPMGAGFKWLEENKIEFFDFPELDALMEKALELFQTLYPGRDFNEYGIFHGGVSFRGEVYKASVKVVYGMSVQIEPLKSIEISEAELQMIEREFPEDFWEGFYSVADLWDFAYGIDDLRNQNQDADDSWQQARSQLASTYRTLDASHDLDSAIQSICMTAELSLKGVLYLKGVSKKKIREMSHDLGALTIAVNACTVSTNPGRLELAVNRFPPYVKSRYKPSGLTKPQLLKLAMQSQFVAGECLRRISLRDLAFQIEAAVNSQPRRIV